MPVTPLAASPTNGSVAAVVGGRSAPTATARTDPAVVRRIPILLARDRRALHGDVVSHMIWLLLALAAILGIQQLGSA
jgi:hypothetical protein